MTRWCLCGCDEQAHKHYTSSTNCSQCACSRFQARADAKPFARDGVMYVFELPELGRGAMTRVKRDVDFGFECECTVCGWYQLGSESFNAARAESKAHAMRHRMSVVS